MTEKGKGLLAWLLSLIGSSIVLFGMKDASKNTKLHAAQSLVLSACYILVTIILSIVVSAMSWRTLLYGGYTVVSVIRGIGIVVSVVSLMIIGIREVTASAEEKSIIKEAMPGYILGAIMVFVITLIPTLIYNFSQGLK